MLKFLKNVFSSFLGTCLALLFAGLFGMLGFFMIMAMIAGMQNPTPSVAKNSILVIDLSMSINDRPPSESLDKAIREAIQGDELPQVGTRALIDAIHTAQFDSDIEGILLLGNLQSINYGSGYAALVEVREALEDFKGSGKPVYGYLLNASARDYYLLSVCSELVMNPFGSLSFNGLATDMMFYAKAFEKWGIGVQVTRVGKYKAAVEPYIKEKMSPENRMQTEAMIQGIWDSMRDTVSEARGISHSDLDALSNSSIAFDGDQALEGRLVDRLEYFDVVLDDLKQVVGEDPVYHNFRQTNVMDYIHAKNLYRAGFGDDKVAVVYVEGVIVGGKGDESNVGGHLLARHLRKLRQDDSVKAVVMRVNSPGGSAQASEVIEREVRLLKKEKPVVVSMGYVAASGGYWISANADRIFAEENTITGSIGVLGVIFDIQGISDKIGITWDSAQTHEYAHAFTATRPRTEKELAEIQKTSDFYYDSFIKKVAKGRGMDVSAVDAIAQGRVWLGYKAKEIGLVDEIGGLYDAIEYAAEQADLDEYELVDVPRYHKLEEVINAVLEGRDLDARSQDPLSKVVQQVEQQMNTLKSFNDPQGIYLLMDGVPQL